MHDQVRLHLILCVSFTVKNPRVGNEGNVLYIYFNSKNLFNSISFTVVRDTDTGTRSTISDPNSQSIVAEN